MICKYVTNNNHRNENMMGYNLYTLDGFNNHLLGYNGYIIRINMDIATNMGCNITQTRY